MPMIAFTTVIAAAPHNTQITRFVEFLGAQFSASRKVTWDHTGYAVGIAEVGQADHAAILRAIEAGDAVFRAPSTGPRAARARPCTGSPRREHWRQRNNGYWRLSMQSATFFEALAHILPADCLKTADEDMRPYECDGLSMYRALPKCVAPLKMNRNSHRWSKSATPTGCRSWRAGRAPVSPAAPCQTRTRCCFRLPR